jgi:signal transduction histidine kinase
MKLVSKTLFYYLLISLPLLVIAGLCSYYLIKAELRDGTDESLLKEKSAAEHLISSFNAPHNAVFSADSLSTITVVNEAGIQHIFSDTSLYDVNKNEFIPYRVLKSVFTFNSINYQITVFKATIEEEELMEGLLSAFVLIIAFLVFAFFIVSWLLSKTLWLPFYKTLSELNLYDIKGDVRHKFSAENTIEFDQLNKVLNSMTDKLYADYILQKEFTENASHEMQTPLAVVKANLSLLMQSPNLKEEEMRQLQVIDNTTKKLASLNKALLLLSKIESNQFKENEIVNVKSTLQKALDNFAELIQMKNLSLVLNTKSDLFIKVNPVLAEILITNLLQNAIRHNNNNGRIEICLLNSQLQISNTGEPLNIGPDDLFVRFKKNDNSKDSLGLGLSIVKSITSLYNYSISYTYTNNLHTFTLNF